MDSHQKKSRSVIRAPWFWDLLASESWSPLGKEKRPDFKGVDRGSIISQVPEGLNDHPVVFHGTWFRLLIAARSFPAGFQVDNKFE